MYKAIQAFINYIHESKGSSKNTEASYQRDLKKVVSFLNDELNVTSWENVSNTNLNSYMLYMENQNFANSSVCRSVASMRAFFRYLLSVGIISEDPSVDLNPPKVEKKAPLVLSVKEVDKLLSAPDSKSNKGIRDKAMLELLYATGIRVSELIGLKVSDVNMKLGYIVCRDRSKERIIPFGKSAETSLKKYLNKIRSQFIVEGSTDEGYLFTNVRGSMMTRQGFWKVIKSYSKIAGITSEITPHTLRHSFAIHMIQNGSDLKSLQEMLGHSDIATTHMYENIGLSHIREVYDKAHPRK